MRKPTMTQLGVASFAIIALMGFAACAEAQSPASTSTSDTSTTVPATTSAPANATATATTGTAISQADAERIALAAVPGSRVTETRLQNDRDRAVWNVHLSTPTGNVEIKVDQQTGSVIKDK
jgi:uncharacterized membrane protein YkoI